MMNTILSLSFALIFYLIHVFQSDNSVVTYPNALNCNDKIAQLTHHCFSMNQIACFSMNQIAS